jgi:hypothetical protein
MSLISVISGSDRSVPNAPTIGTATNVGSGRAFNNGRADVTFTAPTYNGRTAITSYTVTSSPGGFTASGASSPISVTGLASATAYTFTVTATNAIGTSAASSASNSITATTVPQAPTIGTATDGGTGTTVSVPFTANATGGTAITSFTATSSPGSLTATGGSSPLTVSGLTTGTAYTFTVTATNANGTSAASAASNSVTPASPSSFDSIVSGTATSTSITFSSLPQTYKHLQIRLNWTVTGGQVRLYLNNASAAFQRLTANNGSNVTAQKFNSNEIMATSADLQGSYPGVAIIEILDYASTTKKKVVRIFSGNNTSGGGQVGLYSQLYTTTAVTSIVLDTNGSGVTGTTAIYGIKG